VSRVAGFGGPCAPSTVIGTESGGVCFILIPVTRRPATDGPVTTLNCHKHVDRQRQNRI
jgi:hypothetical protein